MGQISCEVRLRDDNDDEDDEEDEEEEPSWLKKCKVGMRTFRWRVEGKCDCLFPQLST